MISQPSRLTRGALAVVVAGVAASTLSGCVAESAPVSAASASTAPSAAASSSPTSATPAPTPTTAPRDGVAADDRVAARCDNIMDPASGRTVIDIVLPEGADPLPPPPVLARGVTCVAGAGTDQFFAWSPASREEWDALVADFAGPDDGWFTEPGTRGTYLTYKSTPAHSDADGYGQTYLFTGDAVILAPTKAATAYVIGPPAA